MFKNINELTQQAEGRGMAEVMIDNETKVTGRSREEILAALNTRLAHTPEEEQAIIGQQLREIAVLRLEGLIGK